MYVVYVAAEGYKQIAGRHIPVLYIHICVHVCILVAEIITKRGLDFPVHSAVEMTDGWSSTENHTPPLGK